MYPFVRMAFELSRHRKSDRLTLGETHVTPIRIWPWDIDPFMELNNGRQLTLMDLGRFGTLQRLSVPRLLRENGWWGAVAGSTVRYRRRITVFQKLQLRSRILGWDDRFIYFEQALWRKDECCAHAVIRIAVTGGKGIVPTPQIAKAFDFPSESPVMPDWVQAWARAEQIRTWPPAF